MDRRREVLGLIAERTKEGRSASFRTLVRILDLSEESACDCLKRLWRERLIEAVAPRPPRFQFRLRPGESLRDIRFTLTRRGRERLRWWREREKRKSWPW